MLAQRDAAGARQREVGRQLVAQLLAGRGRRAASPRCCLNPSGSRPPANGRCTRASRSRASESGSPSPSSSTSLRPCHVSAGRTTRIGRARGAETGTTARAVCPCVRTVRTSAPAGPSGTGSESRVARRRAPGDALAVEPPQRPAVAAAARVDSRSPSWSPDATGLSGGAIATGRTSTPTPPCRLARSQAVADAEAPCRCCRRGPVRSRRSGRCPAGASVPSIRPFHSPRARARRSEAARPPRAASPPSVRQTENTRLPRGRAPPARSPSGGARRRSRSAGSPALRRCADLRPRRRQVELDARAAAWRRGPRRAARRGRCTCPPARRGSRRSVRPR